MGTRIADGRRPPADEVGRSPAGLGRPPAGPGRSSGEPGGASAGRAARERLLAGTPVSERRLELGGISTAVLEGGEGPPIVLLHGPGDFAATWMGVIPSLVETNRVVAPDLPAHGASEAPVDGLGPDRVLAWIGDLIERTCPSPPALVGHVVGGAMAARFAVDRPSRLSHLVLVDALGLGRFRPAPRFALTMLGFQARPSERSYERFMRQCSHDLDRLREDMGERWDAFVAYAIDGARRPDAKAAKGLMREVGIPRIPPEGLARIPVPTTLIWGRHDRANRLRIAEAASARYGWSLHVIEDCGADPPRDRPDAFLEALHRALGRGG